jgi:hypothetical protein
MEQPKPSLLRNGPEGGTGLLRNPLVRIGAVVALAIAACLIAWLVIDSRGGSSSATPAGPAPTSPQATTVAGTGPVNLSADGLRTLTAAVGQPIYWAGPKPNTTYELTRTTTANVYIRYLPPGVEAGAPKADYLIIVTYPFPGAYESLRKVAGGRERDVPGGGIALVDAGYPSSVHMAFPGVDFQVEVYDPSPQRALAVALSGDVQPVG